MIASWTKVSPSFFDSTTALALCSHVVKKQLQRFKRLPKDKLNRLLYEKFI